MMKAWTPLMAVICFVLVYGCGGSSGSPDSQEPADGAEAAQGPAAQVKQELRETADAIAAFTGKQKDGALDHLKKWRGDMDARIAQLADKAESAGDKSKAVWRDMQAGLKARREAVAEKAEALRTATGDKAENAKAEMAEAMESLRAYVAQAAEAIGPETEAEEE